MRLHQMPNFHKRQPACSRRIIRQWLSPESGSLSGYRVLEGSVQDVFAVKRSMLEITGMLDERFYFCVRQMTGLCADSAEARFEHVLVTSFVSITLIAKRLKTHTPSVGAATHDQARQIRF